MRGVARNKCHGTYQASVGFMNLLAKCQNVKELDQAIDLHMSLVQLRHICLLNMKSGQSFQDAFRQAVKAVHADRAAAQAVPMRLRFRCVWRRKFTPTEWDVEKLLVVWEAQRKLRQKVQTEEAKRPCRPRAPKAPKACKASEAANASANGGLPKAAIPALEGRHGPNASALPQAKRKRVPPAQDFDSKLAYLKKMVEKQLQRLEATQRRQLKKTWGMPELPAGLQQSSFQETNDSLCAVLDLSDGTQRLGPFRKSVREAERDLRELREVQRRGDRALCEELRRRDLDAMTAFFVQSLGKRCSTQCCLPTHLYRAREDVQRGFSRAS